MNVLCELPIINRAVIYPSLPADRLSYIQRCLSERGAAGRAREREGKKNIYLIAVAGTLTGDYQRGSGTSFVSIISLLVVITRLGGFNEPSV